MSSPSHFDPGPWQDVSETDGIRTIVVPTFLSFVEFVDRIGANGTDDHYLWRGQRRAEWEILSTLGRNSQGHLQHLQLERFVRAIARSSQLDIDISNAELRAKNELRVWSLGQHWGLKTPLIDFTVYPYFALFFAFAQQDTEFKGSRAVFALDGHFLRVLNYKVTHDHGIDRFNVLLNSPSYSPEFANYLIDNYNGLHPEMSTMVAASAITDEVKKRIREIQYTVEIGKQVKTYAPMSNENQRIHAQGGYHVYTPNNDSIEEWIRKNRDAVKEMKRKALLTKILIPNSERVSVLSSLNKMNVNYLTALPDFEGAARHCNMALDEKHLGRIRGY